LLQINQQEIARGLLLLSQIISRGDSFIALMLDELKNDDKKFRGEGRSICIQLFELFISPIN
jgi:hypothetical protein